MTGSGMTCIVRGRGLWVLTTGALLLRSTLRCALLLLHDHRLALTAVA